MQKCPTCLKEGVISTKDSHIFPNIYFKAMQERFKEALYTLGKPEGTQVFYGRNSPCNREETKDSNPDWYSAEEAELHPNPISQKNLVCDDCEEKFSFFIETQVGNSLKKIREEYKKEYDSQVAYDFYALFISMLHREDISEERYPNYNFKTNESEILRTIIDDIFQGKTDINLLKDLSLSIYQFKGNINDNKIETYEDLIRVENEDDENKRFSIFIGEILTYDDSYKIILGDFIIEFSFDKSKVLENSDTKKLIINVLDDEEEWEKMTNEFLYNGLVAQQMTFINEYLAALTSDESIHQKVRKDLADAELGWSSNECIKEFIKHGVKHYEAS